MDKDPFQRVCVVGVGLIGLAPVLTFVFPPSFEGDAPRHLAASMLALALGFLLLTPGIVRFVDRFVGHRTEPLGDGKRSTPTVPIQ